MKILQIVADGSPGGGTTNVLGLISDILALPETPHQVDLITQADSHGMRQGRQSGANCYGLDFFRSRLDLTLAVRLRRLVSQLKPDLIHFHGGRAAFFGNCLPGRYRAPVAYTVRGYHFLHKPWLQRQAAVAAERWINRQIDVTVLVCRYDQQLGRRWGLFPSAHQTVVIHNGIDPSRLPAPTSADPKRVGFLGRLDYQKDPFLILDIAAILAPEGFQFRLIGGGDLQARVQAQIKARGLIDTVSITGALSHSEALANLSETGALLLPSRWEGLPIAPVEAMWMGIPVVASDVSGIPEIIDSGIDGLLISTRDPFLYAQALRRLAAECEWRRKIIAAGRAKAETKFLRRATASAYLALYDQLCGAYQPPTR